MSERKTTVEGLTCVHPQAAGFASRIGAAEIWAAIPPERGGETVRVFGTFTPDLQARAGWLGQQGIDTVAMESTGVYWIPIFELLEARGLKVFLVNAWHLKHVPGRKSDYLDCPWIQKLHSLARSGSTARFARTRSCARCGPTCGIGRSCWSIAPPTSCTCRRRYNK